VTLRCALESDLERTRALADTALTLQPGERREVPVKWNTGTEEYGYALAATLVGAAGGALSSGREYFSVADNLWKVGMTISCRGEVSPNAPGGNEGIPFAEVKAAEDKLAAELAQPLAPAYWSYCNWVEYDSFSPDNCLNLIPDRDYWYGGQSGYSIGTRWIKLGNKWLHRRGMRSVLYVLPGPVGYPAEAVFRQHPDWFSYDADGQLNAGFSEKRHEAGAGPPGPFHVAGGDLWLNLNIARPEPIDRFVDQVIKAHQFFGWDGIRFDDYPYLADGYDLAGHKIDPGDDPKKRDELEVAAWKRMRDGIWKVLGPNFGVGINSDRDLYYAAYPAEWDECCRQGQLLMEEVPRSSYDPQSPRNRWHDYLDFYHGHGEIVRGLGGHHLTIAFDRQNPVDSVYLNVLTFAIRAHPYAWYGTDDLPLGNYAQFATRYSALLWDIDRVKAWPEVEKSVTVTSAAPVWWRELACVRTAPDGKRQYILHLINPPANERIYADPTNKTPAPLSDISVTLKTAAGEKITRAVLLSAEPVTHAEALPVTVGEGQVTVTVPRLYFWSVLVFE
jgi:hypothetical protein